MKIMKIMSRRGRESNRMPERRRLFVALAGRAAIGLAVLLACGTVAMHPATAQEAPSATIELSGGSVAAGVGYSWGSGTLAFQGTKYPLKVSGLSIVNVGASEYTATGVVLHLTQVSDITGNYVAGEAGATLAGGGSLMSMKNDRGVVINMTTTRTGLQLTLAPTGLKIELAK
jgi:hypothetical protein